MLAPQHSGSSVFNPKDLNQYDFPSSDEEPFSQVPFIQAALTYVLFIFLLRAFARQCLGALPPLTPPCVSSPSVPSARGPSFTPVCVLQIHSGSSEAEEESDPDGCFAFRRKAGCQYYAVSDSRVSIYSSSSGPVASCPPCSLLDQCQSTPLFFSIFIFLSVSFSPVKTRAAAGPGSARWRAG